jgi:hypothetical protein
MTQQNYLYLLQIDIHEGPSFIKPFLHQAFFRQRLSFIGLLLLGPSSSFQYCMCISSTPLTRRFDLNGSFALSTMPAPALRSLLDSPAILLVPQALHLSAASLTL